MLKVISVVLLGSWDAFWWQYDATGRLQSCRIVELVWICQAIEGESPVSEMRQPFLMYSQVVRVTWNPVRIREAHLLRLNTTR